MNETDVRELIVRPLIHRLGYELGTSCNVRTEVRLTYDQRILGRRKPRTDHRMGGFVDYVCDVVSCGRWIAEVKAPHIELSEADWEQAHSYAAHPEIAATYFLLTNGQVFRAYSMLEPRKPILEWTFEQQDLLWINIQNLLGPQQLRRKVEREQRNRGKALAEGLPSRVEVVGGRLDYGDYDADPVYSEALHQFVGLRATVESGYLSRDESGRLHGHLKIAGPTAQWDAFNKLAGIEGYDFSSADEYVSTDQDHPTIFQAMTHFSVPAGASLRGFPGVPPNVDKLPFALEVSAFTQAVGFVSDHTLRGVFTIVYAGKLPRSIEQDLPKPLMFTHGGEFYVNVS